MKFIDVKFLKMSTRKIISYFTHNLEKDYDENDDENLLIDVDCKCFSEAYADALSFGSMDIFCMENKMFWHTEKQMWFNPESEEDLELWNNPYVLNIPHDAETAEKIFEEKGEYIIRLDSWRPEYSKQEHIVIKFV